MSPNKAAKIAQQEFGHYYHPMRIEVLSSTFAVKLGVRYPVRDEQGVLRNRQVVLAEGADGEAVLANLRKAEEYQPLDVSTPPAEPEGLAPLAEVYALTGEAWLDAKYILEVREMGLRGLLPRTRREAIIVDEEIRAAA